MGKKILVTGSTGNIGSFVVKELIDKCANVKAAVTDLNSVAAPLNKLAN